MKTIRIICTISVILFYSGLALLFRVASQDLHFIAAFLMFANLFPCAFMLYVVYRHREP